MVVAAAESTEGVRVAVQSKVPELLSYSLMVFSNSSSLSYAQSRSAGRFLGQWDLRGIETLELP